MLTELEFKIFKKCPDHLRQPGEDHQQDGVGQEDHHGGHPGGQQSTCSLEMILIQCCNNNSSSDLTTKAISRPPLFGDSGDPFQMEYMAVSTTRPNEHTVKIMCVFKC